MVIHACICTYMCVWMYVCEYIFIHVYPILYFTYLLCLFLNSDFEQHIVIYLYWYIPMYFTACFALAGI